MVDCVSETNEKTNIMQLIDNIDLTNDIKSVFKISSIAFLLKSLISIEIIYDFIKSLFSS